MASSYRRDLVQISVTRNRPCQYAESSRGRGMGASVRRPGQRHPLPGVEMSDGDAAGTMTDAADRERRPLRCGEPALHRSTTEDGVGVTLSRFQGGTKGPVILTPGFGTSSLAYTLDTT